MPAATSNFDALSTGVNPMPDTMIPTATVAPNSPAGIVSDYRSPLIGQLVAARAKATSEIKRIVKDKKAEIQGKPGGRSFSYAYADLADVMDAVDDALAAQEMALFQTIQDRGGKGAVLVTTLAHSSDQWIASEVRIASPDAGPEVFGSSLTYMRRYCALGILGLAPDTDDDGKAAQDRADQQARQRPAQRVEASRSTQPPPGATQAIQRTPSDSGELSHIAIPTDVGGLRIREWLDLAKAAMDGKSGEWRRRWLELHQQELANLRSMRPDWADRVEAAAIAPDLPQEDAA
jgi:hypothetical protein